MTDPEPPERPRPQYGEYATPEEQRARIRQSDPTAEAHGHHAHGHPAAAPESPAAPSPAAQSPAAPSPAAKPPRAPSPTAQPPASDPGAPALPPTGSANPLNRIVTIALLVYGAINVTLSAASFLDLSAVADASYRMMGIPGSFTDSPAAQAWGIAAAVVLVAGFVLTAVLAVRRMRRGRISWWIPLVGAAATYVVVTACISIPLLTDPAFQAYLHSH